MYDRFTCFIYKHLNSFSCILAFPREHPFLFIWSYINKQRRKVYLVKLPTISANKQNDVCCCKILWNILQGILQNGPNGPICISHYINRITNVDIFLFFFIWNAACGKSYNYMISNTSNSFQFLFKDEIYYCGKNKSMNPFWLRIWWFKNAF